MRRRISMAGISRNHPGAMGSKRSESPLPSILSNDCCCNQTILLALGKAFLAGCDVLSLEASSRNSPPEASPRLQPQGCPRAKRIASPTHISRLMARTLASIWVESVRCFPRSLSHPCSLNTLRRASRRSCSASPSSRRLRKSRSAP